MAKKISVAFIFFVLFVILSALSLWIAANIVISSRMTKMFVAGNIARIINSSGGGDINIAAIKLSQSKPPSIILSDIKIYSKVLPPPRKKTGETVTIIESRPIIFSCEKTTILPDYRSFIKGKRTGAKKIAITDGNLNLFSSKFALKNINFTISDVPGEVLSSLSGRPDRSNNLSYGIRSIKEREMPVVQVKSDFTLLYDNKPVCDVLLEDGVFDFSSQELRLNKLSAALKRGDVKIQDIKGIVKFVPTEGLSYHLAFECTKKDVERFLSDKKEVVMTLKMLKFKGSKNSHEEKFYVVISNKNISKSPTEISITPQNSGMKIQISL